MGKLDQNIRITSGSTDIIWVAPIIKVSHLFSCNNLVLHKSEVFICKAFKAEAIVLYASALITQQMKVSGSPKG